MNQAFPNNPVKDWILVPSALVTAEAVMCHSFFSLANALYQHSGLTQGDIPRVKESSAFSRLEAAF